MLKKWVPHELSEAHQRVFDASSADTLLIRHSIEGILNRTCDEKLILYNSRKCSSQWFNPRKPAKSCAKLKLT